MYTSAKNQFGQVAANTMINWKKISTSQNSLTFVGSSNHGPMRNDSLFRKDFNFESLGKAAYI